MISSVKQMGELLSEGKDSLDSLIQQPKSARDDGKKAYTLKVVFNLIENTIDINKEGLSEYQSDIDNKKYIFIGTKERQGTGAYPSFEFDKIVDVLLSQTFFRFYAVYKDIYKEQERNNNKLFLLIKQVLIDIYKIDPDLQKKVNITEITSSIKINDKSISEIAEVNAEEFNKKYIKENLLDLKKLILNEIITVSKDKIVLVYPSIRQSNKEEQTIAAMEEIKDLLRRRYLVNVSGENQANSHCYLCKRDNVQSSVRSFGRGKINNIFVTTTVNYASNFDKNSYPKNYKICDKCYEQLMSAENYIAGKMQFYLAGIPTYIMPQFFKRLDIDYEKSIEKIKSTTELAFKSEILTNFISQIESEKEYFSDKSPYMINFVSFLSDGNSIKVINHVKDVSVFQFKKIVSIFAEEHMQHIDKVKRFNLNSIYKLIPLRFKTREQVPIDKTIILSLYSSVFSLSKIDERFIYHCFAELVFRHFYTEHDTAPSERIYKNIKYYKKEHFDFAIKDSVYQYLIIINSLKKLNLFNNKGGIMVDQGIEIKEASVKDAFVIKQGFTEEQAALFYLGCLISAVGRAQWKKGHKDKPILKKINYQGMRVPEIKRLYLDVFEKLNQYKIVNFVNEENKKFKELFDRNINDWQMSEVGNVFYLLSGYAFNVESVNEPEIQDNNKNEEGEENNE